MRQNNSVSCTARAGSMAPELGSELDTDSGISGQCLRSGAALRCDDTSTDSRVDAEACRLLGLGSLAVTPVGKWPKVSGVLEAFSANTHAFDDTEVRLLVELADLVVTPQGSRISPAVLARQKLAIATRKSPRGILILAAVVVLAFLSWLAFKGKGARSDLAQAGTQQPSAPGPSSIEDEPPLASVQPVHSPARSTKASLPEGVVMASTTAKTARNESLITRKSRPDASGSNTHTKASAISVMPPRPKDQADGAASAPALTAESGGTETILAGVLSPSSVPPVQPALTLSQGISGGTIERHIEPVYPPQARAVNLEGNVVLQGIVTENGNVRDLKIIDGNPVLARAAMDAVAQWRYRPYRLNGQPIRMKTEITLIFKLR